MSNYFNHKTRSLEWNCIIGTALLLAAAMLAAGCGRGDSEEKLAREWLGKAQSLYDEGSYEDALAAIDSLRRQCPGAIDERRQALSLWQEAEIALAQREIEKADKELQLAAGEYERMRQEAEASKAAGKATAGQLTAVTRARIRRDSLQTVFDVQCAKIKYIRKKQAENAAAGE